MNKGRKINLKYILGLVFTVLLFSVTLNSQPNYPASGDFYKSLTPLNDTTRPAVTIIKDTTVKDSLALKADTTFKDSLGLRSDTVKMKVSKDSLEAPIYYSASDSVVMDVPAKTITLYNNAESKYKTMTLDAYKIQLDQPKQIVIATYSTDTSNNIIGRPKMVETENTMTSDSIIYDMKTQKGITKNTFTQSGEIYIQGKKIKKISPTEYYAFKGQFTTCNLDTPHFAFVTNKMKLINKKMAISGPVHPEFEGVPIPIYIPFGYFPISQGRHSGFLPPTFTQSPDFGLGLEGIGYYRVLSDNFDVTAQANLYSYGGWSLLLKPEYRVRYHYSGTLNLRLQNTVTLSNTGKSEFDKAQTFSVQWSHVVDSKARPGQNFSASVNVASSKFNQYVYNNPTINFQNNLSSSITYSKTWDGKYNLTVSGSHNQNNITRLFNVNLPNIGFTATTIYPFQQKEFIGTPKWYEKLGIGLSSNITGQASFFDSLFSFHQLIDTFQWGAQHNIPITLSLPSLFGGSLQIAPGIGLQQKWYSRRVTKVYDSVNNVLNTAVQKGFFTEEDLAFSLNLSTAIFGTFDHFGKKSSILGIRHVIRPTIGITYKPNLAGKDYYYARTDSIGDIRRLSHFEGSSYGPFSEGTFGGVSFGLDNNIEMKVRSKSDTSETGTKKIKLIDGIGFTGSYNYLADSFKLSPISFYLRSTLFGNFNITSGITLDPYIADTAGNRKNIYAWANGGKFSLGRITTGNLAISTSFKSKPKDTKKAEADKKEQESQLPMTYEEEQSQLEYIRNNPAQFADFNIEWSLNLSFSVSFYKALRLNYSGYDTKFNSTFSWNGDFNLTPKWKLGMNSYLDTKYFKIASLTMFLSRDMHCWQMSINVTPVGLYRSFNITLSPKSAILRDLKVNRTRTFAD